MNALKKSFKYSLILLVLFNLLSCKKNSAIFNSGNKKLISYVLIDSLSLEEINGINSVTLEAFLNTSSINASNYTNRIHKPKYTVRLYRVNYESFIPELGKSTIATGLIAIPNINSKDLPVISYQHGTVFDKRMVPSMPEVSAETQFMVSQFASQGYVLIAADYFGLGDYSTEPNSYFVRYSTEQSCLDMYYAALEVFDQEKINKTKFFVSGWSQGAYNTMLYLRRLEKENIAVNAAFTAAAPVDPMLFVTRGLFNPRPFDAQYTVAALCNMIMSIEKYNNLEGISKKYIKSEYHEAAKSFYNFKKDYVSFIKEVPTQLDSVFTQTFYDEAKTGDTPFWQILRNSEAYRWFSPIPLRAYYGMYDEAVPEKIATLAVDYMQTLGKQNATTHNAGIKADHRATYIESIIDAKPWIDSFN